MKITLQLLSGIQTISSFKNFLYLIALPALLRTYKGLAALSREDYQLCVL